MAPGVLGKIDLVIFSLLGFYILNMVLMLLVMRVFHHGAWNHFTEFIKQNDPFPAIREAIQSDPRASTNSFLEIGLVVTEVLLYPVVILFLGRIGYAAIVWISSQST